jgi:hypothetical protein
MADPQKPTADPSALNAGLVMTTLVSRAVINGSSKLVKVMGLAATGLCRLMI